MVAILWGIIAVGAALVGLTLARWFSRGKSPALEPDELLPATPLQRLARWGLLLGLVPGLAAAWMAYRYGAQTLYGDDDLHIVFTLLLLAIIVVFLVVAMRIRTWVGRSDSALDERDRDILGRAPVWQSAAMLLVLVAWTIGLSERFHDAGAVPVFYLPLVFWSCWAASLMALPVGILIGYRRH